MNSSNYFLPEKLPENLVATSISLTQIGINNLAWKWNDAIEVINYLYENDYVILGGDICVIINGDFTLPGDSWYIIDDKEDSLEQYMLKSKNKAINYIEKYRELNGEDFYCCLVYEKASEVDRNKNNP